MQPYVDVVPVSFPIRAFKSLSVDTPEDITDLSLAHNAYNVIFCGRQLLPGYGTEPLVVGTGSHERDSVSDMHPERIFRWQVTDLDSGEADDRLIVWRKRTESNDAGCVYYLKLNDGTVVDTTFRILDDVSCTLNYKFDGKYGFIIFKKNGGAQVIYDDNSIADLAVGAFSDALYYNSKFFAIVEGYSNKIFYHSSANPSNWHESYNGYGYLNLENEGKGVVRKLLPLKDNVYALSDYGITRLTMYTDRNTVKPTAIANFRGKLLKNTAVVAGENIIFATTAGVFSFDGFNLKRIYQEVTPLILYEHGEPNAYYYEDKYYLAGRVETGYQFMGDEVNTFFYNNAVFILDLIDHKASVSRGFDVRSFYEVDYLGTRHLMIEPYTKNIGKLCQFNKNLGRNLDAYVKKYWLSPYTDYCENGKIKCVRRIILTTESDVDVIVRVDDEDYTYKVKGGDKPQTVVVNKGGNRFSVALATSKPNFHIGNLTIEFDLVRRYNGHQ